MTFIPLEKQLSLCIKLKLNGKKISGTSKKKAISIAKNINHSVSGRRRHGKKGTKIKFHKLLIGDDMNINIIEGYKYRVISTAISLSSSAM